MTHDETFLDRLISFILDYVTKEPVDELTAEIVYENVYFCFNRARDRRERDEQAYVARCGTLLQVLPKIREHLSDQLLADCKALEEVLIDIAAERRSLPMRPRRRRRKE